MASRGRMSEAREHIERMRRDRYYIGREESNPLADDMHQAVAYLSEEIYSKDVHFLMELIQNAEDNEYPEGVAPSLEFVVTSKDITATGAESTLLVFNNERGFSPANIDSICRVGKSTKKGSRGRGYIGEKGIGFKSVFLISSQPHIFSNGYQIRFDEEPCTECGVGYIVPKWVEENPTLLDIQTIYGSSKSLPATTIILPLKNEKVLAVKQQLSKMHPEILLFLSKIKWLSVREHNDDPERSTVSQISILKETDFQMRKNMDAESYTLHLAAQENAKGANEECNYYLWKQKFPVRSECRSKKRSEVDEWIITLAFPYGQRLNRGMRSPGVYAFLPTEMVTNFPFIIQADFLLASSRESILLDDPWNKGILNCVPIAFVNAFVSLVKSTVSAPSFSIPPMFEFLPINSSPIPLMDSLRISIKEKVIAEHIVPCESYTGQKIFCKPNKVGRLFPDFWDILVKAKQNGVNFDNLSSHGTYILSSSFDRDEYDEVLEFLGLQFVDEEWYGKCIESSNLAREVSEEVYMDLLNFVAHRWKGYFCNSNMQHTPFIKYTSTNGKVCFWSIHRATQWEERICVASDDKYTSWLINWNMEFASVADRFFMPKDTQMMLNASPRRGTIMNWLKSCMKLDALDVYDYGNLVVKSLRNRKDVIAFTHFLYHSRSKNYISEWGVKNICSSMPLVDNYGSVTARRTGVLVPAKGSKWVGLIGSNPWRSENYIELGADYMSSVSFAGIRSSENQLLPFLRDYIQVSDIPEICPPNASFPAISSPLRKENVMLLLEWIRSLKYRGLVIPEKFLTCIKNGSWVKTTSNGYKPPSECFLSSSDWGSLLQMESVLVDIPMIDQSFYDYKLGNYKEELRTIGVRFEFGEASKYIGNHLMSMAASSCLTARNVFSLLKLIRVLREKHLSPEQLVESVKDGSWLKTRNDYRSPVGSILFNSEWRIASSISNLSFIDTDFYGMDIFNYKPELEVLGVITTFNRNYQLVVDNFKLSTSSVPADAALLLLECIRYASSSEGLVRKVRDLKWLKTQLGYKSPMEIFLADSEWQCLLEVVEGVPFLDEGFYGYKIRLYGEELKKIGVVTRLQEASKAICVRIKELVSSSFLSRRNVLSLLECYRQLKKVDGNLPTDLINCICNEKWLCTRLGFRSPCDSILLHPSWEHISPIANLPFIDDSETYYGKEIYEYRDELRALGVAVELEAGVKFVVTCLNIPKDSSVMSPLNVLLLLKCIRILKENRTSIPEEFLKSVNKKWLKTLVGYKSPRNCILFDSKWESFLQRGDGPFIDEEFYGSDIISYRNEVEEIGVVVNAANGCPLLADHLKYHDQISVIARIYMYLKKFEWEPENNSADWIWIPSGTNGGEWVSATCCVLHDKDNLFGSHLHVLDRYYDEKLFGFFSMALHVKHGPTVDDYCRLWNQWETDTCPPTYSECSAFWIFIAKQWNEKTKKLLTESLAKLPVYVDGGLLLSNKLDVFIPDDLLLKDLFDEASREPIFIWYPETSMPQTSRAKMNNIYISIGVRTISTVVEKSVGQSSSDGIKFIKAESENTMTRQGLFRIVLGFLADPSFDICWEKRHNIVKCLLGLTVFESDKPPTVSYKVSLTSGVSLSVKATRMLRWERENYELFMQTSDMNCGMKERIESATYFSKAIAEGLLFERADQITALSELIKMGYLLDFEEEAVKFLLKSKNLQLFAEDEKFLSAAFSSPKV